MPGIVRFVPPPSVPGSSQRAAPKTSEREPQSGHALRVPNEAIVAIEHPCIVKNVDNAVKALGGEHHLKHIVHDETFSIPATTSLRPHDPFAKELVGRRITVDHVLLRISVPKRTGRKRKRGSNDPFEFHGEGNSLRDASHGMQAGDDHSSHGANELPLSAERIVQRLREVPGQYDSAPVTAVKGVHRFRDLPDFQHIAQDNDLSVNVAQRLKQPALDKIKAFMPDFSVGLDPVTLAGPPGFAGTTQQLYYGYAEASVVRNAPARDDGEDAQAPAKKLSATAFRKRHDRAVPYEVKTIPTRPPAGLLPLGKAAEPLQQAVRNLNAVMDERPIITRRAAMNMCPTMGEDLFKAATEYCGYAFKSGPWRDCLVRFGIDPRTSQEYRKYQTLSFQLAPKDHETVQGQKLTTGSNVWLRGYKFARPRKDGPSDPATTKLSTLNGDQSSHEPDADPGGTPEESGRTGEQTMVDNGSAQLEVDSSQNQSGTMVPSHIFDGRDLGTVNKTFQAIDVIDPMLKPLLDSAELRTESNLMWGWYANGTLSTVRVIMREKIARLLAKTTEQKGRDIEELDRLLERVIRATPAWITPDNLDKTYAVDYEGLNASDKKYLSSVMTHVRALAKSERGLFRTDGEKQAAGDADGDGREDNDSHDGDDDDPTALEDLEAAEDADVDMDEEA